LLERKKSSRNQKVEGDATDPSKREQAGTVYEGIAEKKKRGNHSHLGGKRSKKKGAGSKLVKRVNEGCTSCFKRPPQTEGWGFATKKLDAT